MQHADVIKLVSANTNKLIEIYEDLENLEASCDMIADSESSELPRSINIMINSLIKFKTSKFELFAEAFCSSQNCGSEITDSPANLDITSEHTEIN